MLTKKQYKFLKKLIKNDIHCDDLHDNRDEIYLYLLKNNFIATYLVCPPGDVNQEFAKLYCKITEEGKVELLLCKQDWYHFWIPTVISIIALIVSVLPIACSYVQTVLSQAAP